MEPCTRLGPPKFTNQVQHRYAPELRWASTMTSSILMIVSIGHMMGRSTSTIGRELRRNSIPKAGYKPASADRIAFARRRRLSRIERLSPPGDHVRDHLAMGWSPEQIAGRLRLEGSGHRVSHGEIYSLHLPLGRCAVRSCIATCLGPRRPGAGAVSNAGAARSRAAAPFMSADKPLIPAINSAIGRATSCGSAPSEAIF